MHVGINTQASQQKCIAYVWNAAALVYALRCRRSIDYVVHVGKLLSQSRFDFALEYNTSVFVSIRKGFLRVDLIKRLS